MVPVRNEKYDTSRHDSAQQLKEGIAAYRGKACGVGVRRVLYGQFEVLSRRHPLKAHSMLQLPIAYLITHGSSTRIELWPSA